MDKAKLMDELYQRSGSETNRLTRQKGAKMKQTINFSQFCDSFTGDHKNNFSYEGKRVLFDYLEQYEEDTSEEIELDPIALCCEYTEYKNLKEFQAEYGEEYKTREDIKKATQLIPINNEGFIIQAF